MMKKATITSLAALMLSSAGAFAQDTSASAFTTPAGYVTHTLEAGQFNLLGLTLHESVVVAGSFESVSGTALGDNDVDFTTILTSGTTYVLEITNSVNDDNIGKVQEVVSWTTNEITTSDDLGLQVGDEYQIRASATISSVFGEDNSSGLQGATSSAAADNIYVRVDGGFDVYYFSTGGFFGEGWRRVGGGATDFSNQPLFITDAIYIQRNGATDLDLILTGSVKTGDSQLAVTEDFSFLSGVFPVGSTFESSGMQASVVGGSSSGASDNVLIQVEGGGFDTYYYSTGGFFGIGWRKVGDGSTDHSTTELPSAFILSRVGTEDFNLKLDAPESYDDL